MTVDSRPVNNKSWELLEPKPATESNMTDTDEFNCVYCEKRYKNRGWLANHINKKHEDAQLLEKDMTVLRDNAQDISHREAVLNLSENPFWDNDEQVSQGPTSTPIRIAGSVPLCPKASSYVQEMGKSLPASFLATLLPAPGFLDNLDKSIQEENNANYLLKWFKEDIRFFNCDVCKLTFLGSSKLRDHVMKADSTNAPVTPAGPNK